MQQMTMVMPGCAARRMPCWVPATAKDASPIVSIAWDSHPSIPVPMCERTDTPDSIGQKKKVTTAVTTHIVTYSACRGAIFAQQSKRRRTCCGTVGSLRVNLVFSLLSRIGLHVAPCALTEKKHTSGQRMDERGGTHP